MSYGAGTSVCEAQWSADAAAGDRHGDQLRALLTIPNGVCVDEGELRRLIASNAKMQAQLAHINGQDVRTLLDLLRKAQHYLIARNVADQDYERQQIANGGVWGGRHSRWRLDGSVDLIETIGKVIR